MKTNLEIVREAVIAAVPEIRKKGYGCEVVLKNTRRGTLYFEKFKTRTFVLNKILNHWDCDNGWIDGTEMASLLLNDDAEIIGRPIRLSEILLATENYWATMYSAGGGLIDGKKREPRPSEGVRLYQIVRKWNLRNDDLNAQSEECISFLAELLK